MLEWPRIAALLGAFALTAACSAGYEYGTVATATDANEAQVEAPSEERVYTDAELAALANPSFSCTSVNSWGSEEAPADGSVGLWGPNYYIVHTFSEGGQAALTMQPGEAFAIDGTAHLIEGAAVYDRSADVSEVYDAFGYDKTYLQTCIPDTSPPLVRIVYGE